MYHCIILLVLGLFRQNVVAIVAGHLPHPSSIVARLPCFIVGVVAPPSLSMWGGQGVAAKSCTTYDDVNMHVDKIYDIVQQNK